MSVGVTVKISGNKENIEDVVNTLWFKSLGGNLDEAYLLSLNIELITWWGGSIAPQLSPDIQLVEVTSTDQTAITGSSVSSTAALAGTSTGASMPGSVCLTITFKTPFRGRSGRGRNYISGLREVDCGGNACDPDVASDLAQGYDELRTSPLLTGDAVWGVVSHYSNGSPRASGLFQEITSTIVTDIFLDSQRRRLAGRGS